MNALHKGCIKGRNNIFHHPCLFRWQLSQLFLSIICHPFSVNLSMSLTFYIKSTRKAYCQRLRQWDSTGKYFPVLFIHPACRLPLWSTGHISRTCRGQVMKLFASRTFFFKLRKVNLQTRKSQPLSIIDDKVKS